MNIDYEGFGTLEGAKKRLALLEEEFRRGSGKAAFQLELIYSEGNTFVADDIRAEIGVSDKKALDYHIRSFELLTVEAETGDGESMHLLAMCYQSGLPPLDHSDMDLFGDWTIKAAAAGYVVDQDLLAVYGNPKSKYFDRQKARELWKTMNAPD